MAQELKTHDRVYSRARYLDYEGRTIGDTKTGVPCTGLRFTGEGVILRFNEKGQLSGGWEQNGDNAGSQLPAIEMPDGHVEYWIDGKVHREPDSEGKDLPAVVSEGLTWEEYWIGGRLLGIVSHRDEAIEPIEPGT